MSASMGQHDSNEVLLSYLDREQSAEERVRVEQHLAACWLCRSRLQELERTAQEVARMAATGFISPDRAARARDSFLMAQPALERVLQRTELPVANPERWFQRTRFAIPLSIAAGLILVFGWLLSQQPNRKVPVAAIQETAHQIAERIELNERKQIVPRTVTHQVFGYRIESGQKAHAGRVEVWADDARKRYASRVFDVNGQLVHAVWQSGSADVGLLPAAFAVNRDVDDAQARFQHWLDRRSGSPLLLAAEFVEYCRRAQLEITMIPLGDLVRLSATRFLNDDRMELSLEVTAKDYRVQRQVLRIWRRGRQIEFVVDAKHTESLMTVSPAVFQPVLKSPEPIVPVVLEPEPVIVPEPVIPLPTDLRKLEVAVLYALHEQGVFSRDSWDVRRDGQRLLVRVVVATETRKEILLNALRELDRDRQIDSDVQTWTESGWKPPTISIPKTFPLSGGRAAAALNSARAVFGDGWALQQLAERFNTARMIEMDDQSRALLERMLHDHLVSLQRRSVDLRETLSELTDRPPVTETQQNAHQATSWQDEVHGVFHFTTQIRDRTQSLLLEPNPQNAPVRQTADELIVLIDTLAREAKELDLALLRLFEHP